jgi:serine/threonine-protein kinase
VSGFAQTGPLPPDSDGSGFSAATWSGRIIDGRYRVLELLGQGGMGAVFLAEHIKLGKKVALKVILPQFAGDGELAERFAREAMASAKLDHPHVASAIDYGTLPEGGAYLVMQYVRGRSLRQALESEDGGWRFACEIGAQIADALAAAHAEGIVHRDLKPENVILEPREGGTELVKVLDFGVARVVSHDPQGGSTGKALTRIGTVLGTPGYMAPEQALGEVVDARADLYALGVVLWEVTAKRTLFPEQELTAIVTAQLTATPPRLGSIVPDVPAELDDLVSRLLARNREARPSRAAEVRDVLKRLALSAQIERDALTGKWAVSGQSTPSPPAISTTANTAPTIQAAVVADLRATRPTGDSTAPVGAPDDPRAGADRETRPTGDPSARAPLLTTAFASALPRLRAWLSQPPALPPTLGEVATRFGVKVELGPLRTVPTLWALVGCAVLVFAAPVLLGVAIVLLRGGDSAMPATVASPVTPPPTIEAGPRQEDTSPPAAPVGEPAPPATVAEPPQPREARALAIPPEIARDVSTLLENERREAREAAARRLRRATPADAPPFVAAVVDLELAERCPERRRAVRQIAAIGDPRALPALERLDRNRRGCGFLGMGDCHGCLRRDLRIALRRLRAAAR